MLQNIPTKQMAKSARGSAVRILLWVLPVNDLESHEIENASSPKPTILRIYMIRRLRAIIKLHNARIAVLLLAHMSETPAASFQTDSKPTDRSLAIGRMSPQVVLMPAYLPLHHKYGATALGLPLLGR